MNAMLTFLSLFLMLVPQGKVTGSIVPHAFLPLYQASADFSSGEPARALARLQPLLAPLIPDEEGNTPAEGPERKAARMLLAVHQICSGHWDRGRTFWNALDSGEQLQLAGILLGRRVISLKPAIPNDLLWIQVDGILGVYTTCSAPGLLFFADHVHTQSNSLDVKQALFEWIPSLFTGQDTFSPEHYKGIGAYFVHATRRLRHHWLSEPFSETDLEAYQKSFTALNLSHPYPSGTPWRISALVPLTGNWSPLGLQMLQALAAVREEIPALEILVHNTNSSPAIALSLLQEEVLLKDRPLAVILPPDPESARMVLEAKSGMLFFSAADGTDMDGFSNVFFAQTPRRARVAALVRSGIDQGARKFGILHPKTSAGRELADEAVANVKRLGGTVVFHVAYDPNKLPEKLNLPKLAEVQAVLIPDAAVRVAGLARRLAAAGAFPGPLTERGKGVLLLATAEALSPSVVSGNARYFSGATFAPGFYADAPDPEFTRLVEHFTRMKSTMVLSVAAETYWWIRSLPQVAVRSAGSRLLLREAITRWNLGPGRGDLFDSGGRIRKPPRLYRFTSGRMTLLP